VHPAAGALEDFQGKVSPALLGCVTAGEVQMLKAALTAGQVPADFQLKLCRLELGGVMHQYIAHHCRVLIVLLRSAFSGVYKRISEAQCDELLRVLAYVRKDDDVIPDYATGGFQDDLQEVRAAIQHLEHLLSEFKGWRLCHQVPSLWHN
jgi:hypothetical protein